MVFQKSKCVIRKLYCGDGKPPKDTATKKYSRKGTQYECLKKGYGIAEWEHRKKNLSKTSLQQITYIGQVFEANFKKRGIYSIKSLLSKTASMSSSEKRDMVKKACTRKNGSVDYRAFNSVILFLHENGVSDLPSCRIVSE